MTEQEYWLLMNLVFYAGYEEHTLLEDWFGIPGQKDHWEDPYSVGKRMGQHYDKVILPDLCGNCFTVFGMTVGGRLKHKCVCCSEPRTRWDSTAIARRVSLFERYTQCLSDSPIIHYLTSVYPTRAYDGPILEKAHDPRA